MHLNSRYLLALTTAVFSLNCHAGNFNDVSPHLDTDGAFVTYMNFEGDGKEIGDQLNAIYAEVMASTPKMMPIPLDFNQLFETLGFGTFQSVGMSSKELAGGLHVNRSITTFNGELTGLFVLYKMDGMEPTEFEAAQLAPADANIAACGPVNLSPLADVYRDIMIQTMGPMGESMVKSQLAMPVPNTELSIEALLDGLSGHWNFAYKIDFANLEEPQFKIWAELKGKGALLEKLRPISEEMPVVFKEVNGSLIADFSMLTKETSNSLFIEARPDGNLVIYTDASWTDQSEGLRLAETEEFKRMTKDLPEKALWYSYSSDFNLMESFEKELSEDPMMGKYFGAIDKAYQLVLADFYKPTASAAYFEGDHLISVTYGSYSYKQVVMLVPSTIVGVYAGIGYSAYRAFSSFSEVSVVSQEKTAMNNLRQIASAADQYFLEEGKTEVKIEELVGPDKYILSLEPVAGESYEGMVIKMGEPIRVTLGSGEVVELDF